MSGLTLPFWAGWRVLATNPFDSGAIIVLQVCLLLTGFVITARLLFAELAARRLVASMAPAPSHLVVAYSSLADAKAPIFVAPPGSGLIAAVGLLKPALTIDFQTLAHLDAAEAAAVLEHERAHVRRRDALRITLAGSAMTLLCLALLFSISVYSAFLVGDFEMSVKVAMFICIAAGFIAIGVNAEVEKRIGEQCEFSCDAAACRATSREALASAILKLARLSSGSACASSVLRFNGRTPISRRITRALCWSGSANLLQRALLVSAAAMLLWMTFHTANALGQLRVGVVEADCFACCLVAREMRRGNL